MAKFELFKDVRGEYRWRLRSANGQIFAVGGEGFKQKSGAQSGIDAVKRDASSAEITDMSEIAAGKQSAKKSLPRPM